LDNPKAGAQTVKVPTHVRSKLMNGTSGLVIGGLHKRNPPHHWDGRIEGLRILQGVTTGGPSHAVPSHWNSGWMNWSPSKSADPSFVSSGSETKSPDAGSPARQALHDLCQVLMNMNEFFYLH
jgi:hypothetical protein